MDRSPRDPATDAGLLVLAVIWGVNFSVVKAVLGHLDPLALNALRFPIAAAALWLVIRSLGSRRVDPEDRLRLLLLGLLGNVVYQLAFIIGIDRTLAGNASLLLATTPVWTVLLSVARGHERLTPLVGTGALLTLVGMVLVVMGSGQEVGLGTTTLAGDALMALAAVLWATYTVGSSRLVQKYGPIRVTTWTLWVGTPVLVLMAVPELAETNWTALPLAAWGGVMYSGLFALAVAYLLWYRGVQRIGNSKTAVYSNLVPVVALITAWIWLMGPALAAGWRRRAEVGRARGRGDEPVVGSWTSRDPGRGSCRTRLGLPLPDVRPVLGVHAGPLGRRSLPRGHAHARGGGDRAVRVLHRGERAAPADASQGPRRDRPKLLGPGGHRGRPEHRGRLRGVGGRVAAVSLQLVDDPLDAVGHLHSGRDEAGRRGAVAFLLLQPALELLLHVASFVGEPGRIGRVAVPASLYPVVLLVTVLLATVGTPLGSMALLFGEEYGWRGFLLSELEPLGRVKATLIIGTVWAVWHTPVILSGIHTYAPTPGGFALAWLFFTLWSFVQTYVVARTGSIWAAAFIHGVVNGVYGLTRTLVRPDDKVLSFGLGVYGLLCLAVVVAWLLRDPLWREGSARKDDRATQEGVE
jgi:drug/metabolite transporter (DMT)-like permease/membrane protease YdiL (CAAX protease family)